jgi:hypothetical protein
VTLEVEGRQIQMAGGIPGASYPEPELSSYTAEDLAWLADWVSATYAISLQATLKKGIREGQIGGRLAGETFLPDPLLALSPALLHPPFAGLSPTRPWISLEEIFKALPDLSQLNRETVLSLLREVLKESPYPSLGAGRWTTPELFNQLNRDVPLGLPTPHIRSSVPVWTRRDEQDLAGYDRQFMPAEARRALEELWFGEKPAQLDPSRWRPPKGPLRLPALNYLHITQAYFPVGNILQAFPPELQLVFVQLINGEHQPFLLDRENGLLKAVHPEEFRARILKESLPAGTYLWLEYEGSETYRIAPRLLPFKRMVPCKLACLEDGRLHIEHTQTSMMFEGDPSLFRANMDFETIAALLAEASRVNLSVRDAIIYAIEEICATDPDRRAHWLDIFNAVFLRRMCSPSSVVFLLYMQPCFEALGNGYFRYKPAPDVRAGDNRKPKDRLAQIWGTLLLDPVAPDPVANERAFVAASLEPTGIVFPTDTPDLELASVLRAPEPEPEIYGTALSYAAVDENVSGSIGRREEEPVETFVLRHYETEPFTTTPTDAAESTSRAWRESVERLFHGLVELENAESSSSSPEEADSESGAPSDQTLERAHEESLSFSSPFRWEPKPAWIDVPVQSQSPYPNAANTGSRVYRPRIPVRPLHKQPFYRRLFFYLGSWLSRLFRKTG